MNSIDEMLALGEGILRMIKNDVDHAEVFISRGSARSLSIEKNVVKSVSGGGETGIALRILKENRMGFAYFTDLGGVNSSLERALQGSRIAPEKPFEFPSNQHYYTVPELLDKRVLDLSPEEGQELTRQMIDAACDVHEKIIVTGGGLSFGDGEIVIMNTSGLEISEHVSSMGAYVHAVFMDNSPSSGYEFDSSHLLIRNFEEIGRKAAELAVMGQNPRKIETKRMPVIFKPEAISSLMEFITIPAIYGIKAEKGESVYSQKIDTEVISPELSIVDDPTMPDGENSMKMDDEGVPSRCIELIKNGVLKEYLYTIGTGAEFEHGSTASGLRGGGQNYTSPISTSGRNIILQGNTSEEETMISEIDEGLLVYDILGAHTSNPASGDFSVTGSILFHIQRGEITCPVSQVMFSGNFPEYLKQVTGLGNNYRKLSGGLSAIGFYMPSVRIDDMQVTGEI